MFWDTVQPNEDSLDSLLAKEDVNLYEILEEPTCLQEIKCEHDKLLDFLGKDEILLELLRSALALKFPDNGQPPTNGEVDTRNGFFNKDQYKFAHLCTEALCLAFKKLHPKAMSSKPFMALLLNYLDEYRPQLNHLVVGFYVRLIVALLQAQPNEKWDDLLVLYVNSDLVDHCVASLNFGAINDLFSNILVVSPDFQYRLAVKDWYTEKCLARQLVECFDANRPAEFQENAAYIWADFVKSLRDYQYSLETKDDPLLESLTEDHVMDLLVKIFGPDADTEAAQRCEYVQSDSVLSNGASVLNALLESKYDRNAPSVVLAQANSLELSIPGRDIDGSTPAYVPDAERVVEHAIARRSKRILELALECVQAPVSANRGDVFVQLMQLLGNLLNTNDLDTHAELLKAFQQEGTSLRSFFDVVRANPMMTVYNTQLTTVVVHILFSNTGNQHPLLEHLINDVGLLTILREALPETMPEDMPFLKKIAHRSFFFNLADRVQFARRHAPMSDLVDQVIESAPDYAEWAEFCEGVMIEYADLNRSDSLSDRPSNMNGTFDVSVDEFDTAGSVLSGFNGIELKVSTPEKAAAFDGQRRSPQTTSGIFSEFPPSPRDPHWSTDAAANGERSESPTAELFRDIFAAKRDSPRSAASSTVATAGGDVDDWPGALTALADDWPGASAKNVEQGLFTVDNDGFKPAAEFCFEDTNGHDTPSREIANALLNGVKKIHESSTADTVPSTPPRGAPPTEDWPTTPKQRLSDAAQQDAFGNFSSPKVALKPDTAVSDDEEY